MPARGAANRIPPVALVVASVASVQFGAALAATLFDELDAATVSVLRLGFAAIAMLAIWRPRPSAHAPADLRLAAGFGLVLGQGLRASELAAIACVVTASAGATRFAPGPPEPE